MFHQKAEKIYVNIIQVTNVNNGYNLIIVRSFSIVFVKHNP